MPEAELNSRGPMLRTEDAARYLSLSRSTLEKMRCRGDGPVFISTKKIRLYDRADLDAWLASRRRASTSATHPPEHLAA